jgi:hypothetical protein
MALTNNIKEEEGREYSVPLCQMKQRWINKAEVLKEGEEEEEEALWEQQKMLAVEAQEAMTIMLEMGKQGEEEEAPRKAQEER